MSLFESPTGERIHIGFFGRRNAGKSSLVNAITGQALSVVSPEKGTTTDPVRKAMELLPLGPVLIIDTPGYDDTGALGALRVQKTREILQETDLAVLVVDAQEGLSCVDHELLSLFRERSLPHLVALNQIDLSPAPKRPKLDCPVLPVSAVTGENLRELKEQIARLSFSEPKQELLEGLVQAEDVVLLVTPIDSAAPKARMILPQQQVIRAVLDAGAINLVVREHELSAALQTLSAPPALVITDSQAFAFVRDALPPTQPLTSFSILFARYKGFLQSAVAGVRALEQLPEGARILIAEGCTHHRQCDDIGTVKLPRWIQQYCQKTFSFEFCSGRTFPLFFPEPEKSPSASLSFPDPEKNPSASLSFPEPEKNPSASLSFPDPEKNPSAFLNFPDPEKNPSASLSFPEPEKNPSAFLNFPESAPSNAYDLVIHCGACMLGDTAVLSRMRAAQRLGIPFTNYGVVIAQIHGILERSLRVFS